VSPGLLFIAAATVLSLGAGLFMAATWPEVYDPDEWQPAGRDMGRSCLLWLAGAATALGAGVLILAGLRHV
jgi:hypothetical protein